MKFQLRKTSDYEFKTWVEIETIDQLLALVTAHGMYPLVISPPDGPPNPFRTEWEIEIYDDYRE